MFDYSQMSITGLELERVPKVEDFDAEAIPCEVSALAANGRRPRRFRATLPRLGSDPGGRDVARHARTPGPGARLVLVPGVPARQAECGPGMESHCIAKAAAGRLSGPFARARSADHVARWRFTPLVLGMIGFALSFVLALAAHA